eukprot:1718503-Pleurochrysis_carterae.AAC.1
MPISSCGATPSSGASTASTPPTRRPGAAAPLRRSQDSTPGRTALLSARRCSAGTGSGAPFPTLVIFTSMPSAPAAAS